MADEILEAKIKLAGAEEAVTEYGQAAQRMAAAVDSISKAQDPSIQAQVDQVVSDTGLDLQELRQTNSRVKQEITRLVEDFRTINKEIPTKLKPKRGPPWLRKLQSDLGGLTKKLGVHPEQMIGDAGRAIGNIMGQLIPTAGGVGGLLGFLIYGIVETQELRAKANQFQQIFEESMRKAGSAAEKTDREAAAKLSGVAQELEMAFKATRAELETVGRTLTQAGISSGEQAEKLTYVIGKEQENLFGLTLSLERHFELAGGSVARQATELMTQYGMSVQETAETLTELQFAGAKSDIGLSTFTTSVMQATAPVRHMGINVEEVGALVLKLQKQYEGMGLDKHFSGAQAMAGVQQILGGIASFGVGEQAVLAERLGMGKGLEGRQRLLQQLMREGGPEPDVLARTVTELRELALEVAHGDPVQARFFLEQKLGFSGAKAVMDIGEKLKGGLSFEKLSVAEKKALAGSLQTEAQKTETFQKAMKQITHGMAQVGVAIFNILMAGLAEMILSVQGWIALLRLDTEKFAEISKIQKEIGPVFAEAGEQALGGITRAYEAVKDIDLNLSGTKHFMKVIRELDMFGDDDEARAIAARVSDPTSGPNQLRALITGEDPWRQQVGEAEEREAAARAAAQEYPTTLAGVTRENIAAQAAGLPGAPSGGGTMEQQPFIAAEHAVVIVETPSEALEYAQKVRARQQGRVRRR